MILLNKYDDINFAAWLNFTRDPTLIINFLSTRQYFPHIEARVL